MFCGKCGFQLEGEAKFCPQCGENLTVFGSPSVENPAESFEPKINASVASQQGVATDSVSLYTNADVAKIKALETEKSAETPVQEINSVTVSQESVIEEEKHQEVTEELVSQETPEETVPVSEPQSDKPAVPEEFIGKTCSFCRDKITADDVIAICSICESPLHKECWAENGACATFGCTGRPVGAVTCRKCGTEIFEGEKFCSKCGSPRSFSEIPAPPSVPAVPYNPGFNPANNPAVNPTANPAVNPAFGNPAVSTAVKPAQTKSKALVAVIGVVAVVLVLVIGLAVSASNKKKAAEEYVEKAESFYTVCNSAGVDLEDVGNDVHKYWKKYVTSYGSSVYYMGHYISSPDDAVNYAHADNYYTIQSIESDWETIQSLYKELKDIPDSGNSELKAIYNDVKAAYEAFEDMYECVINVSGSYTSYDTEFTLCDSALAEALEELGSNFE